MRRRRRWLAVVSLPSRQVTTRRIDRLLPPAQLETVTRALATLDAIVCEEWESRYYSFNSRWAPGERMASMRDGCGDEWFIVFCEAGAFLKGFAHESQVTGPLVSTMIDGLPEALAPHTSEPAFSPQHTSYVAWWTSPGGWRRGSMPLPTGDDPDGSEAHLSILDGEPATYQAYAKWYFEVELDLGDIAAIYAGAPLTAERLERMGCTRTLAELAEDLDEIGYAR